MNRGFKINSGSAGARLIRLMVNGLGINIAWIDIPPELQLAKGRREPVKGHE
jgi:hypothetical protein